MLRVEAAGAWTESDRVSLKWLVTAEGVGGGGAFDGDAATGMMSVAIRVAGHLCPRMTIRAFGRPRSEVHDTGAGSIPPPVAIKPARSGREVRP
jgi:hypothetical protein